MDNGRKGSRSNGSTVSPLFFNTRTCKYHWYIIHSYRKKQKDKLKEIRRKRKQQQADSANNEESKVLLQDERFKAVDSARFEKKHKGRNQKNPTQKESEVNPHKRPFKSKVKTGKVDKNIKKKSKAWCLNIL